MYIKKNLVLPVEDTNSNAGDSWLKRCNYLLFPGSVRAKAAASLRFVGSSSESVPASAARSADYRRISMSADRRQRLECGSWSPLWALSAGAPPAPSPPPPSHSLPVSSRPCAPHPSRRPRTEPPHVRAAFVGSNYIIACGYIKPGSGIADACLPADRRFWTVSHRAIGRMDACVIRAPEPFFFFFTLRRLSLRGNDVGGLCTYQHSHVRRHLMGILVASDI